MFNKTSDVFDDHIFHFISLNQEAETGTSVCAGQPCRFEVNTATTQFNYTVGAEALCRSMKAILRGSILSALC
jgi:hypothetical protein